FILQQFDTIMESMLSTINDVTIDKITVIDAEVSNIDQNASMPMKAASASEQIKQTLGLDLPTLRDVLRGADHDQRMAVVAALDHAAAHGEPEPAAVGVAGAVFALVEQRVVAAAQIGRQMRFGANTIVGMHLMLPRGHIARHVVVVVGEQAQEATVVVEPTGGDVPAPQAEIGLVEHQANQRALFERLLQLAIPHIAVRRRVVEDARKVRPVGRLRHDHDARCGRRRPG
ncbi:MAG: hypothetical protein AAF772_20945, partial [Acidobacteriota bacterium]